MVLDGAIDPTQDPLESLVNQMAGFQVAFNDYAADCAKSPACPLGTDPAQFVARYRQFDQVVVRFVFQIGAPQEINTGPFTKRQKGVEQNAALSSVQAAPGKQLVAAKCGLEFGQQCHSHQRYQPVLAQLRLQ
jgi:hypothetical protein